MTLATQKRQIDVVKALLNHSQVNINQTNRQKDTALHLAVRNQDQEMVKLLIEKRFPLMKKMDKAKPHWIWRINRILKIIFWY